MGLGLIHDHRLALLSYAQLRGLTATNGSDGKSVRVWFPDGQVTVEFDGLGRIGQLSAEVRPPQRSS